MKHESRRNGLVRGIAALLVGLVLAGGAVARQSADQPADKPAAEQAEKAKKLRGRLPAYYGKVVSEKQRQQIYEIQAKYREQLAKLKKQLADLVARQKSEVQEVLTPEQRAEVEQLRSKRKRGRSSTPAAEPDGGDDTSSR